jgi:putative tricarboxylic transport membrane protein
MTIFIRIFAKVTIVRTEILAPMLLVLSIIASYASQQSLADLFTAVLFGFLGYLFRRNKFPLVNLVMGLLLGRLLEISFAQSLMMTGGTYDIFVERPATAIILGICLALIAAAIVRLVWRARAPAVS